MKKFITIKDRELVEDWQKSKQNIITGYVYRGRPTHKRMNNLEELSNE